MCFQVHPLARSDNLSFDVYYEHQVGTVHGGRGRACPHKTAGRNMGRITSNLTL